MEMFGIFKYWLLAVRKSGSTTKSQQKKLSGVALYFGLKADFLANLKVNYQTVFLVA